MIQDVLSSRRAALANAIRASFGHSRQVDGLVVRLALAYPRVQVLDSKAVNDFEFVATREEILYQGFPRLASIGFGLDCGRVNVTSYGDFLEGIVRLHGSGPKRIQTFGADDVALLGVSAGLAHLSSVQHTEVDRSKLDDCRSWMLAIIDSQHDTSQWTTRMRLLAGDLLDNRGRLRTAPAIDDTDAQTLDLALRHVWPHAVLLAMQQDDSLRRRVLSHLLSDTLPQAGDLERSAIWLCVLSELAAREAETLLKSEEKNVSASAPIVFISYTHDSADHEMAVLRLSDRLRSDGVDCQIDQYEVAPTQGWPRWMEEQAERADYVLVVCTEAYLRRFRGEEDPGIGLGATWEGGIITQEMYDAQGRNTKFIPVVFVPTDLSHRPRMLKSTTYYDLSTPDGYDRLLRRLTQQPKTIKPPLGSIRRLPRRQPE